MRGLARGERTGELLERLRTERARLPLSILLARAAHQLSRRSACTSSAERLCWKSMFRSSSSGPTRQASVWGMD